MTEAEFRALKPGDKVSWDAGNTIKVVKAVYDGAVWFEEPWYKDSFEWHDHYVLVEKEPSECAGRLSPVEGYESLASVLDEALAQAQAGKGKERHANGEPYDAQKIVTLNLQIGSEHGAIFQGCKKAQESARLEAERGDAELLGAINYLAAAVIIRRKLRAKAK